MTPLKSIVKIIFSIEIRFQIILSIKVDIIHAHWQHKSIFISYICAPRFLRYLAFIIAYILFPVPILRGANLALIFDLTKLSELLS